MQMPFKTLQRRKQEKYQYKLANFRAWPNAAYDIVWLLHIFKAILQSMMPSYGVGTQAKIEQHVHVTDLVAEGEFSSKHRCLITTLPRPGQRRESKASSSRTKPTRIVHEDGNPPSAFWETKDFIDLPKDGIMYLFHNLVWIVVYTPKISSLYV